MSDIELWAIMSRIDNLQATVAHPEPEAIFAILGDMKLEDLRRAESLLSRPGEGAPRLLDRGFLLRTFRALAKEMAT